jgi:glyoxylase-like metal-dependent hydrolase (beta-lactamase superfamily II)
MHRERVSDNVYWFQSEVYAQVTAGVISGPQWAVVIDTLALPEESMAIRDFVEHELSLPVRYVINTHYHADHSWGNCFFPGAIVISHARCRELLIEHGLPSLESARQQNAALRQVKLVLPHLTFAKGELTLRVGKKNLLLFQALGHSRDGIAVLVEEDRVLFAGDAFMPLPYIVDGDVDEMLASVKKIGRMGLENIQPRDIAPRDRCGQEN